MDYLLTGCGDAFLVHKNIYFSLFLGGLFGSLNHCAGMCGPFVIAQICHHDTGQKSNMLMRVTGNMLIPYHLGRMLTYIILGVTASFVMVPILNTPIATSIIAILLGSAGFLFLLHGLSLHVHLKMPFQTLIGTISSGISFQKSSIHKFALGTTLGFMPCGLVLGAILAVSSLTSPLYAMLGMIAFTFGTLPTLLGIGFLSKTLMQKYKHIYQTITKIIMISNGLLLITISLGKLL